MHAGTSDAPEFDKDTSAEIINDDGDYTEVAVPKAAFWARVAHEIRKRPQWVAMQTGIEQISYLLDLTPQYVLPSPEQLREIWMTHAKCSKEQRAKTAAARDDFCDTTAIETVREITPELAVEYRDDVYSREIAPKSQAHIFGGIRRVLTFAISRAVSVNALTQRLNYLRLLKPSASAVAIDPKPIDVADWRKLLENAQ